MKATLSTPSCTSLRSSSRASSSGPISATVARIGCALLAEQIPEHDRKLIRAGIPVPCSARVRPDRLGFAQLRDAGEVALDVGCEDRHAVARETFRKHLQRHGLAGAGRAGGKSVAIGQAEHEPLRLAAHADEDGALGLERLGRRWPWRLRPVSRAACRIALRLVSRPSFWFRWLCHRHPRIDSHDAEIAKRFRSIML